jgi:hypothetical protein
MSKAKFKSGVIAFDENHAVTRLHRATATRGELSQDPRPHGRHFDDDKHRTASVSRRRIPFNSLQTHKALSVVSKSLARAFSRICNACMLVLALLFCSRNVWAEQDPAECIITHADAQVLVKAGKLLEARRKFEACAIAGCPTVIQKDCKSLGRTVEKSIPTLRVSLLHPDGKAIHGFEVELDGSALPLSASEQSIELDPGARRFRLAAPNYPTAEVSVDVREGQKDRVIVVQFAPRDPASGKIRNLGQILTGVGAFGIVTFAAFDVSARIDRGKLGDRASRPSMDRDYDLVNRMHTKRLVADVSLGVGLVSLGVATYLLLVTKDSVVPAVSKPLLDFDVRASKEGAAAYLGGFF